MQKSRKINRKFLKFFCLYATILTTPVLAHGEETQIEQDRRRLGNSGPLIEQIDPATVR
ncbi:carbohydrate porin, partial [Acetobacter sp. DmW_125133]